MKPSCCNSELDEIIFQKPSATLIYGVAAAGKTNFVLNTIKCTLNRVPEDEKNRMLLIYISTEGSSYIDRVLQLSIASDNVLFAEALDQDHLLHLVVRSLHFLKHFKVLLLIIDSINNHYRVEAVEQQGIRKFIYLLSILKSLVKNGAYVLATAQVRKVSVLDEVYEEPAGLQYLSRWADNIIKIELHDSLRILRVEYPKNYSVKFLILDSGIKWCNS